MSDTAELPSGFTSIDAAIGWRGGRKDSGDLFQFSYGLATGWTLVAEYDGDIGSAWVVVEDPVSYRVCDEGELLDYWTRRQAEDAPVSFAYEIARSAYLDELNRGVTALATGPLRHFLLGGQNQCLEVIARETPRLVYERPVFPAD